MDEQKLKTIIGTLIRESEERTRSTIQETEARTTTHITDSLQPVQAFLDKVNLVEQSVLTLRNDVERITDEQRKNNIIIYGLEEVGRENHTDIAKAIEGLSKSLKLPTIDYDDAYRLGHAKKGSTRPLIIKLIRYRDKQQIFNAAKNLKGSKLSISNDKSKSSRIAEAALRKKKADIMKQFPRAKCQIRNLKLQVEDGTSRTIFMYDTTINDVAEVGEGGASMES
jgi:hypothetical protein